MIIIYSTEEKEIQHFKVYSLHSHKFKCCHKVIIAQSIDAEFINLIR